MPETADSYSKIIYHPANAGQKNHALKRATTLPFGAGRLWSRIGTLIRDIALRFRARPSRVVLNIRSEKAQPYPHWDDSLAIVQPLTL
jgi:hypothetical protein